MIDLTRGKIVIDKYFITGSGQNIFFPELIDLFNFIKANNIKDLAISNKIRSTQPEHYQRISEGIFPVLINSQSPYIIEPINKKQSSCKIIFSNKEFQIVYCS